MSSAFERRTAPPTHLVDRTVAWLVWIVHLLLAVFMATVVSFAVLMSTDNCAYTTCGDEAWSVRAAAVCVGGSVVLTVAALAWLVWATLRRRRASWFVLTCLLLQLALIPLTYALADLAGPVG